MRRIVNSAREEVVIGLEARMFHPSRQGVASLFGDLKLNGTLSLLLHYDRTGGNNAPVAYVSNAKPDQVAGSKLAVYGQVKQRQLLKTLT